jgi:hypothetical protein
MSAIVGSLAEVWLCVRVKAVVILVFDGMPVAMILRSPAAPALVQVGMVQLQEKARCM